MSSWILSTSELDDLDLLLAGAYAPLTGFLDADAAAAVQRDATLPDGTPWPVPITLTLPGAVPAGPVVLNDEQRTPVAELTVERTWRTDDGRTGVAGPVRRVGIRERADGITPPVPVEPSAGPVLGVPMTAPPHRPELAAVVAAADGLGARVVLFPLVGHGSPDGVDGPALLRACAAAAREAGADVVALPVPRHPGAPERDRMLAGRLAGRFGATHVPAAWAAGPGPVPVELPATVLDGRTGDWAPADRVPDGHRTGPAADEVPARVAELLARGAEIPAAWTPEATAHELRRAAAPRRDGVTVLFTGLSGSGKSTIANAVHAALTERADRTVTLLDGDVVRTMLSSELGFSREHRELNVRRIGFVAAEVTRHGGVALCAPIAPYAAVRAEVRAMVEAHGRFLLVHVSTPLEVCESRDRKGLYAKARRGEIAEFTGISDPYEEPADAELTIDASRVGVADAVRRVLAAIG